jgi:hypothetical protein
LEALQRALATLVGARALATPWLRLAGPAHTGEGAEGRREGGEKEAKEGGRDCGRKKIRQRERRGREMR